MLIPLWPYAIADLDVNHYGAVVEEDCYADLLSDSGGHVANGDKMIAKLSPIKRSKG